MFNNIYNNKKILITGHTGFKGSWLTIWLLNLGANIVGISKDIPTNPSMFVETKLEDKITSYQINLNDLSQVSKIISFEQPDFIFHLAAQPIVSTSYVNPVETISSNVMGTANVLEALRTSNHNCIAIIITSDKAYDNIEQVWGYKENDKMGGKDPYSGSKGAAELIIKSYFHSFFKEDNSNVRIAIGRAGNVIGGGDWAPDRIIVDCMKAWNKGETVKLRSPKATRPWQHVLEPLSGYLVLGYSLYMNNNFNGDAFNFGPKSDQNSTVLQLIKDLAESWNFKNLNKAFEVIDNLPFHEAGLLKLNCDKALFKLGWQASLDYNETISFTSDWYFDYYHGNSNLFLKSIEQILNYESIAKGKDLFWTE
jgi:CDP-glucose 4,6-dehydratase